MDLAEVEREIARLDAVYRPVAKGRWPADEPVAAMGARINAEIAELAVEDQAEAVMRAAIELYVAGGEDVRARLRSLFDRYTSFRWAGHLPRQWDTAEGFRDRIIQASMHDQGSDTRDVLLGLKDLYDRARELGIDIDPILAEVAAMSSDEDRYGMGSMREILQRFS